MERQNDQKLLCYCKNVTYGEVRRAIAQLDARRIDQVTALNQAGGGCRTCHPEIQALIDEYRESRPETGLTGFLKRWFTRS